jgi:hypothetical protein
MIEKLQKAHAGKSAKTQATDRSIIKELPETSPHPKTA